MVIYLTNVKSLCLINHVKDGDWTGLFQEQLTDELNRKLANKVLLNVGLCLSLYDILEVGESFVFPGKQMQAWT